MVLRNDCRGNRRLFSTYINVGIVARGRLNKKEMMLVTSHMFGYALGLGVISAIIAYIIRLIFF